jgi:hypothetical protein
MEELHIKCRFVCSLILLLVTLPLDMLCRYVRILLPPEGALFRGGGRGSALGLMLGLISIWRPAGKLRLWAQ